MNTTYSIQHTVFLRHFAISICQVECYFTFQRFSVVQKNTSNIQEFGTISEKRSHYVTRAIIQHVLKDHRLITKTLYCAYILATFLERRRYHALVCKVTKPSCYDTSRALLCTAISNYFGHASSLRWLEASCSGFNSLVLLAVSQTQTRMCTDYTLNKGY